MSSNLVSRAFACSHTKGKTLREQGQVAENFSIQFRYSGENISWGATILHLHRLRCKLMSDVRLIWMVKSDTQFKMNWLFSSTIKINNNKLRRINKVEVLNPLFPLRKLLLPSSPLPLPKTAKSLSFWTYITRKANQPRTCSGWWWDPIEVLKKKSHPTGKLAPPNGRIRPGVTLGKFRLRVGVPRDITVLSLDGDRSRIG